MTETKPEINSSEDEIIPVPSEEELNKQEQEIALNGKAADGSAISVKKTSSTLDSNDSKRTLDENVEPISEPAPSQPAPVPGETERERGLRFEIQRLRTKLRSDDIKQVIEPKTPQQEDPYQNLRDEGYTDEEIKKMTVVVDAIAKNKGYIRAEDSYKQNINDLVDFFVEEHPEYKSINDIDDVRWSQFQSILQSGIYNLSGKTPRQLKLIFEKVNEDVKKNLGESIIVKSNPAQRAAQQHKVGVASHSGGTRTIPTEKSTVDITKPIGGVMFKGFDQNDFKE